MTVMANPWIFYGGTIGTAVVVLIAIIWRLEGFREMLVTVGITVAIIVGVFGLVGFWLWMAGAFA